jgi:AraC-like DNA-binding protein
MTAMSRGAHVTSGVTLAHDVSEASEDGVRLDTRAVQTRTGQTGIVQTRADRLAPLPENVLSMSVARRAWNGVCLDVISSRCGGRVAHHLCYESHTRLAALLEEVGSPCEPRLREHEPCSMPYVPRHLYFVPAGMEIWGYSADMRFVKDAILTFDLDAIGDRLQQTLEHEVGTTPRLRFADDRLWTLIKLLTDVVDDADPSAQLYGDGLTAAIVARLMSRPRPPAREVTGLAPWQLRRVLEYLDAHLSRRVELATLAALVGLSQSHFSHAFRVSTGMAPYRWQLEARIQRARRLLIETRVPLEQIAESTGFADAVHFGRTFRRLTGSPPAAWRRQQRP